MKDIKEKIKQRRKDLNLSLEEIANYVGVSKATVSRWESGAISNMRADKIQKLAEILKVNPNFIIGYETSPTPPKPTVDTSMLTEVELAEFEKITGVNQQLFFNGIENDHDMDVFKEAVLNIILANRKDKKD